MELIRRGYQFKKGQNTRGVMMGLECFAAMLRREEMCDDLKCISSTLWIPEFQYVSDCFDADYNLSGKVDGFDRRGYLRARQRKYLNACRYYVIAVPKVFSNRAFVNRLAEIVIEKENLDMQELNPVKALTGERIEKITEVLNNHSEFIIR